MATPEQAGVNRAPLPSAGGSLSAVEVVAAACAAATGPVAVTGATGWFGAVALDLLYEALGDDAPGLVTAYASREHRVAVADGRVVDVRPLAELPDAAESPSVLLHFAYLTRDKVAQLGTAEYIAANVAITATVIDAIAVHRPKAVVMTSSGAVYGGAPGRLSANLGDPYGALKRLDELSFRAAVRDVGGTCVIPRVFSVAGPRMTKPELYAMGSMIAMAAVGGPIVVQAERPVFRAYCGVDEVVALAFWAATHGGDLVFDSGGAVVEMGALAQAVARVQGLDEASVVRIWDPDGPPSRYVGDPASMEAIAMDAGLPLASLEDLIARTAQWLRRSSDSALQAASPPL